jgi:pimeloyl-ACP methyl ester carboxylesterase
MNLPSVQGLRRQGIEESFASLPDRYIPSDERFSAIADVEITDAERRWRVVMTATRCTVSELTDLKAGRPNVSICTDTSTWSALRAGKLTGLEAFEQGRLEIAGELALALRFESLFRLPGGKPPRMRVRRVSAGSQKLSTLTTGNGPEHVVLLHGLGADKSSFFPTINDLSRDYTVHAVDLPGFGDSSKPAAAPYDAPWMARRVRDLLDALEIDRAHFVGNSMGGRVAVEMGLLHPERVKSLSLLAPALAWRRRRTFLPLVRLLRPELAFLPHRMLVPIVREQARQLFADPDTVGADKVELISQEFCRQYRSRNARIAFYAAARNIYLDEPFGNDGMWTRLAQLAELTPSTLFIWGRQDKLVPAGFAPHCVEALPGVRSEVFEDCGHVPQIERPDRTHALIRETIEAAADLGTSRLRWVTRAAS